MDKKEMVYTNADAIRNMDNDGLNELLCANCSSCQIRDLCGDKYPRGYADWLEAEYTGKIYEEFDWYINSIEPRTGFPDARIENLRECWLFRVIYEYEDLLEKRRKWNEERKEKKRVKDDKTLTINDLSYETLSKVFSSDVLYDTDKIIVKLKMFTNEEVERALAEHSKYLANVYSLDEDFISDEKPLNDRGKIIELLSDMLGYDLDDIDEMGTAIQETLLFEQMKLYGLRKFVFSNRFKNRQRYFNPEAPIVVEILE